MAGEVTEEFVRELKREIRNEFTKRVALIVVASVFALIIAIAASLWAIFKSKLAAELGVVSKPEILGLIAENSGSMPTGAVVSFDGGVYEKIAANDQSVGCPPGWVRFAQADGRFLLGSDDYPGTAVRGEYTLRATAGEPTHTLMPSEIPEHSHKVQGTAASTRKFIHSTDLFTPVGGGGRGTASGNLFDPTRSDTGGRDFGSHEHNIEGTALPNLGGEPHNNMPPYIVLYFCKKT